METRIAYFDETGDDGLRGSDFYVLTSLYMPMDSWRYNLLRISELRRHLKKTYGLPVKKEMHTRAFLLDRQPYSNYDWSDRERRKILKAWIYCIGTLKARTVSVVIDKTKIVRPDYPILENALKYNIQRIEWDSHGAWRYILISDKGRVPPMRRIVRRMCAWNPIPHKGGRVNEPLRWAVEDVFEKDSEESAFIQAADLLSCLVDMYYRSVIKGMPLTARIGALIDDRFLCGALDYLQDRGILNLGASRERYGFVIYPRDWVELDASSQ